MRITVLGAGAMGSLFGGLLAESGHAVTLVDVNQRHIDAVREQGLRLVTDAGDRRIRVTILRPEDVFDPPDWLVVFTKTLHTTSAMEALRHVIGPQTRVLSLQNGLGNGEKLSAFVPLERIAVGVTTFPADLAAAGEVHSHGQGAIRVCGADGRCDEPLRELTTALTRAGLSAQVDPAVQSAIWEKVAFNAALNSLCAVTGCTVGQVGAFEASRALAHAIVTEALSTARAAGVEVSEQVHHTLDHAMDNHLNHKPSMLQDLIAGRPTEIESITGAVVAAAQRTGTAVPVTSVLATLVRLRERVVLG